MTAVACCLTYYINQIRLESETANTLAENGCFVLDMNDAAFMQSFVVSHAGQTVGNMIPVKNPNKKWALSSQIFRHRFEHLYVTNRSMYEVDNLIDEVSNLPWLESVTMDKERYSQEERSLLVSRLPNLKIHFIDSLRINSGTSFNCR